VVAMTNASGRCVGGPFVQGAVEPGNQENGSRQRDLVKWRGCVHSSPLLFREVAGSSAIRLGKRVALWQYVSTITKTMLLTPSVKNRIAFWAGPHVGAKTLAEQRGVGH
jgi:hypothetical protein